MSRLEEPVFCRRVLWTLLTIAFILRVVYSWSKPSDLASLATLPDQREYMELARSIAGGATMGFYDPRFAETVYAYRTPGYPIFLAGTGADARLARIAQAAVDTSTVLAVYLLARRWMNRRASLLAGAMVAVNPFLIYFTGLLLSETLFTALLTWGVVGLAWASRAMWMGVLGSLALVACAIVRPSALFLIVLLPLLTPTIDLWRRGMLVVASLVLAGAMFGPWAARNQRMLGQPILATTNGGITLYDGFRPGATGASDQSFVATMPELREMTEIQRSNYLELLGWRFITENPGQAARLGVIKLARTWSPIPLSAEFGRPLYRVVGLLYAVPLYVLVLWGLWRPTLSRPVKGFLLVAAVYFSVVHVMSVGSLRYRIPVEPLLCVIAAGAVHRKNETLTD